MPDVMHLVTIDAEPERVFDALATAEGVRGWWTRDANLEERAGGTGEFRFYGGSKVTDIQISELSRPERVEWKVLSSFRSEWKGTTILFDLGAAEGGTQLRFAHRGPLCPTMSTHSARRGGVSTFRT